MRRFVKWTWRVLLVLILLAGLAFMLRDQIIKGILERQLTTETGLPATVGRLDIKLRAHQITVQNLTLHNLPEFGRTVFASLPEIHLDYDPEALRRKQLHLHLVRFNLSELNVVRNAAGRTNVIVLMDHVNRLEEARKNKKPVIDFTGIDTLNLSLGLFRYVDMAEPRKSQELNIALKNEVAENVRSPADLQRMVLRIALRNGAQALSNLDLGQTIQLLKNPGKASEAGLDRLKKKIGLPEPNTK